MAIFNKTKGKAVEKKATEKKTKKAEAEQKPVESIESTAPTKIGSASVKALHVIVKPHVTEKTAHMQSNRTYVFVVSGSANKIEVAKAVEELFGVKPVSVRMINVLGHRVRAAKGYGKHSDYKKAMVTLKEGDSIAIHAGV